MEGWLQVPPERNLIGRSAWKLRYVRFSNVLPAAPPSSRASIATASSTRPTTSGSFGSPIISPVDSVGSSSNGGVASENGINNINGVNTNRNWLDRSHSSTIVSTLATAAAALDSKLWNLAIFKYKSDTEPIVRYPIQRITSCYIGDVAANKRKSMILPTLVVNLRLPEPPPLSSSSSTRSFRRRSQDVSARERREKSGTTLLFRPEADDVHSLELWAKQIQARLISNPSSTGFLTKSHSVGGSFGRGAENTDAIFQEQYNESDNEPAASPSSLFLINGEPSTALLSPSLRSKASSQSVVDSDDRQSMVSSSAPSEIVPSPRPLDERRPASGTSDQGRSFFSFKASPLAQTTLSKGPNDLSPQPPPTPPDGRPETILDRFFSSAAQSLPEIDDGKSMSSIARFEALMTELESTSLSPVPGNIIPLPSSSHLSPGRPRRLPSPARRALEFVCTGRRSTPSPPLSPCSPNNAGVAYNLEEDEEEADELGRASWMTGIVSPTYIISPPFRDEWRDCNEVSLLDTLHTTYTNSTGKIELPSVPLMNGNRHSLADFSLMRPPPSQGFIGNGISRVTGGLVGRRGSMNDFKPGRSLSPHLNLHVEHVDRPRQTSGN